MSPKLDEEGLRLEPWSEAELERFRKIVETPENYTCHDCELLRRCPYAYDMYNTNGDCLYIK